MEILTLSSLIGKEILDIRYHYEYENEYGFSAFEAFFKLTGDIIFDIPQFGNNEIMQLSTENLQYYQERFDTGKPIDGSFRKYFAGQTITDFIFCYDETSAIITWCKGYMQLSNGYYITERCDAPPGIEVNIWAFDEKGFLERNKFYKFTVRSLLQTR